MQGITTSVVLSIGRILAETAPLYLTSGLSSSSSSALSSAGQTLTTRIYAQIYTGNVADGINIMYECALVTMILVFAIIVIVHVIIPYYFK
jgi:phosphate transport system permease protein